MHEVLARKIVESCKAHVVEVLDKGDSAREISWSKEQLRDALISLSGDAWQLIETAPKTGEHILVRVEGSDWGLCGGRRQQAHAVVHWFDDPEKPGFYLSLGGSENDPPFQATHWRRL